MFKFVENLEKSKPVVWCGDLNVAHEEMDIHDPVGNKRNPGFTDEERASFSSFLSRGHVDTFRYLHPDEVKYSYWSVRTGKRAENKGWRLDYFVLHSGNLSFILRPMLFHKITDMTGEIYLFVCLT